MELESKLILLQKIGKRVRQTLTVLLVLTVVTTAAYVWKKPALQKLQEKDAYRYERMVDEASRLHWINAVNQYFELKKISPAELYRERYRRWKQQWETSGEFQQNALRQKAEAREQIKKSQKKKYDDQKQELKQYLRKQDSALLRVHWEQATPWQKSLILRDRCVRYLNQELEDYRQRRHVKGSLHGAALLAQSRISNASPGSLCREMVSLSHDIPSVHHALGKLRKGMNYYYFIRLLEDIGISDSELFTVTGKLEGMTRDFNGF
jgi:hypothetical protein